MKEAASSIIKTLMARRDQSADTESLKQCFKRSSSLRLMMPEFNQWVKVSLGDCIRGQPYGFSFS